MTMSGMSSGSTEIRIRWERRAVREVEAVHLLEERDLDAAAALYEAVAHLLLVRADCAAGEDQDLIGLTDVNQLLDDGDADHSREGQYGQAEDDCEDHVLLLSFLE